MLLKKNTGGRSNIRVWSLSVACVLFFFLMSLNVRSQSKEILLAMAAEAWQANDFPEAAALYQRVLQEDSTHFFAAWQLAECYRFDNAYFPAAEAYRYVTTLPACAAEKPEAWYFLALMEQQCGHYSIACSSLTRFLELSGTGSKFRDHAAALLEHCPILAEISDSLPVSIVHPGNRINSPWSEFGAFQLNESQLYFSAIRPAGNSKYQNFSTLDYRSAIYSARITISGYQNVDEIPALINRRNCHNANVTFDQTRGRAFFSRCPDIGSGNSECVIMMSGLNHGRWGRPRTMAGKINMAGYSSTQPFFTHHGEGNSGVLYFVSNRPGGYGGMDIWYTVETNGVFGEPVNCGSLVNTPGNEVTPFYDTLHGCLWFASDWLPGFGGYDIFRATGGFSGWEKPENAGIPFNSSSNDYYFSVNPNDSNGYLTSNRPGSFHIRGETCCNDIYIYQWIPQTKIVDTPLVTTIPPQDTIQQMARNLLPLILYFHNDEPDPATRSVTSSKNYKQTLDEYISLKPEYKKEYASGLSGPAAIAAAEDIEDFFDGYVIQGYEKLEQLMSFLLQDLRSGRSVQLMISGYCSPLSTNEYNINLARRRINSLQKYLETAQNGALLPYINGTAPDSIRLMIFEDPVGKEKASPFVSDNPNDQRNSVYSRAAAFERRIEISMYQSGPPGEMVLLSELPRFVTPSDTVFLGSFRSAERKIITITYKNEGKSELLIRKVDFNDDIFSVEWSNEPLLPGNEQKLMMLIDPVGIKGDFEEKIIVHSNLPKPSVIVIKGNVPD
jgi:outer membrane protein OmpA-like peptidoglycan-associated protein